VTSQSILRLPRRTGDDSRRARDDRFDPIALGIGAVGVMLLLWISRLNFLRQDANFDLLNYHAYVPAALISGTWFSDVHVASIQTYLSPYQDLLFWPLLSSVPAPLATAALLAVELSIFVPAGLILQTTVPSISRSRALGVAFVGVSGAMAVTEAGSTMGDFLPAVLVAWAVYLLLSLLSERTARAERRVVVAALLVGTAVALKFTVAYIAPGVLLIAVALFVVGQRRPAWLLLLLAPAFAFVLYVPWALVLENSVGSPVFPLFNAIFKAPRFPAVNFQDARFPVSSLVDLVRLPLRQALGTAATVEVPFRDVRWLLGFFAVASMPIAAALRAARGNTRIEWRASVPGLALIGLWCASYVTWAFAFGIQRYAMLLEVLAVPVIVTAVSLAVPQGPRSRAALPTLLALAVLLGATTKAVDFGRHPMGWAPIIPAQTVTQLSRYDAIVLGTSPLGYLRAVTRDSPGSASQVWVGLPFNDVDRKFAVEAVRRRSVAIVFEVNKRAGTVAPASSLGLRITDDCQSFDGPIWNPSHKLVVACTAEPSAGASPPP
jgi:hypothetical protein